MPQPKMYPAIKSRILPGYSYPADYPGKSNSEPTGRNDTLPDSWLNVPLSLKSSEREKIAGSPAFLGALAWRSGFSNGYNDGASHMPATVENETLWVIRKVSSGGYTIELATPVGGLKYLTVPNVCFTPLNNAEAALKEEPWPKAQKDSNGNPIPHKYRIQGHEWDGKTNGGDGTKNGMSSTPGYYPLTTLSSSPNEFTTWYFQRSGNLVLLSAPTRPNQCGTRLGPFPWNFTGKESAGQKAVYQDYYRLLPVGGGSPTWTVTLRPVATSAPTGTPVPTAAPTSLEPGYVDVAAGNTSIGLNISNQSDNATNIMNQSTGGGGGGGGVNATTATLLASLLASKSGGSTYPEVASPTMAYPNPYAMPTYATPEPTEAPGTAEEVDPSVAAQEAILQQLMSTPAPVVKPWYATPIGIAGIACCFLLLCVGIWFFFFRKKSPAGSGNRSNSGGSFSGGSYSGGGYSSRPSANSSGLGGNSNFRGSGGAPDTRLPINASAESAFDDFPAFERVARSGSGNGSGTKTASRK